MAEDRRLPLISATGSCAMGRSVAEAVARRLGKTLLELGGNNAVIVAADADLDLAARSTVFGAVGTAGQRCTSTRRVLVERPVAREFTDRLVAAYRQVRVGDPFDPRTLMGPLISREAVEAYHRAISEARAQGAEPVYGGESISSQKSDLYVMPTILRADRGMPIVREETFGPIVYIIEVNDLRDAVEVQNDVPQGLSSALFTRSLQSAEVFLSASGSDCGIANVNLGTSGAEIGGAFGGEKDTGGGREAGSDCWKQYMRRQTNTINFGRDLPLAQGIAFEVAP
jgi:aldehyde dehydrogenase (NAD+)